MKNGEKYVVLNEGGMFVVKGTSTFRVCSLDKKDAKVFGSEKEAVDFLYDCNIADYREEPNYGLRAELLSYVEEDRKHYFVIVRATSGAAKGMVLEYGWDEYETPLIGLEACKGSVLGFVKADGELDEEQARRLVYAGCGRRAKVYFSEERACADIAKFEKIQKDNWLEGKNNHIEKIA